MHRVLVVGAGGFIGRHVSAALETRPGLEVVALTRSESPPGSAGRRTVRLDLLRSRRSTTAEILADIRPDAVVNCAGTTTGDTVQHVSENVLLVARLIEAAGRAAPGLRVVQLGSSAEYGAVTRRRRIAEDADPRPTSTYGITKLAASQLVLAETRTGRIDGVVLRVFNVLGPGMSETTLAGRAAAEIRRALKTRRRVIRMGELSAQRDFVDVRDVAEAAVATAVAPQLSSRLLNVGSGRAVAARRVVAELAAIAGFDGEVIEERAASPRSGDVPWQRADVRSIERTLGWKPKLTLRHALRSVWDGAIAG